MGSIKEMYEEFSDDQILEQLDDFGDGQFFMREVAKRFRAMSDHIATLEAKRNAVRDAALVEAHDEIWKAIGGADGSECVQGLRVASVIVSDLRVITPQPKSRMFPMTDGPDLPWSLAGEIYSSDAFDYYEESRYSNGYNGLEEMAKSGGWSWRALADCFETYSAQCEYESESDTRLERGAESYHAAQEGEG